LKIQSGLRPPLPLQLSTSRFTRFSSTGLRLLDARSRPLDGQGADAANVDDDVDERTWRDSPSLHMRMSMSDEQRTSRGTSRADGRLVPARGGPNGPSSFSFTRNRQIRTASGRSSLPASPRGRSPASQPREPARYPKPGRPPRRRRQRESATSPLRFSIRGAHLVPGPRPAREKARRSCIGLRRTSARYLLY